MVVATVSGIAGRAGETATSGAETGFRRDKQVKALHRAAPRDFPWGCVPALRG